MWLVPRQSCEEMGFPGEYTELHSQAKEMISKWNPGKGIWTNITESVGYKPKFAFFLWLPYKYQIIDFPMFSENYFYTNQIQIIYFLIIYKAIYEVWCQFEPIHQPNFLILFFVLRFLFCFDNWSIRSRKATKKTHSIIISDWVLVNDR